MSLVSIIVPAYNAEETLSFTIEDVLNQTFDDFELIIVNDGSTDNTNAVCEHYETLDKRVKVLNQKNGGLSNARNNGTKMATSEYVTYIDSDDRVEPYYLEYLVRALKDSSADMVCGRTDRVREGFSPLEELQDYRIEVFDKKDAIKEMLTSRKITVGPCNRLTPRDWYLEFPFLEGKKYEDLSNSYKLHLKAKKVVFVDVCIYHYVMRGGSITGSKIASVSQCQDYYEAINLCANGITNEFDDLYSYVAVLKYRDYMSLFLLLNRCGEKTNDLVNMSNDIISWCKANWKTACTNRYAPVSVRLRFILFRISPFLYERMYYIGIRFKGKAIS